MKKDKLSHKDKAGCAVFDKNKLFVCIGCNLHKRTSWKLHCVSKKRPNFETV